MTERPRKTTQLPPISPEKLEYYLGLLNGIPRPLFVSAANVAMTPVDWLWTGVIACGDLTLLGGEPGMGKSQVAAYAAATVSRGGQWPDGSRAKRGHSILCEIEGRHESALRPRLEAAGADLSRIEFGKHMDLSTGMGELAAQAPRLPDLRLLVLSPVLTFFGKTSNDDNSVRAKLRPLLEWAAARSVAVLGIIHPLKQGSRDVFAGCDAYRRAARAAWRCITDATDGEPVEKRKRRLIVAVKVNNAPDDVRFAYRIQGMQLPGGISTSRAVFLPSPAEVPQASRGVAIKDRMTAKAVEQWLLAWLAKGSIDSAVLKTAADKDGIATGPLYRAAEALGIRRTALPGTQRKLWTLPDTGVRR
jgi:putative DNA primase/helicase